MAYLGPDKLLVWLALGPVVVLKQMVATLTFVSINLMVRTGDDAPAAAAARARALALPPPLPPIT